MIYTHSEFDGPNIVSEFINLADGGVMVEVGAAMPVGAYSNSAPFRTAGWKVICIEPIPWFCDEFRKSGYEVLQYAAFSSDIGKTLFNAYIPIHNGMAGSSLDIKRNPAFEGRIEELTASGDLRQFEIEALTLNTILERHHPEVDHITVLSVDTEGCDLEVLEGLDFKKYSPDMMIIENLGCSQVYRDYYEHTGYDLVGVAVHNDILKRK